MSATDYEEKKPTSVDIEVAPVESGTVIKLVTPEDDERIRRKVDRNVLPLLSLIYGLQMLDKTCTSYAAIMGLLTDTGMTTAQYSWIGSIFYFGYLLGEYPLSVALQKLPMAKVTMINVVIWGTILSLIAVARNFTDLMVLRFFLGFFESSITPALSLFTAQWYKTREQGTRTAVWFSCNMSGAIFGALLAYGLYQGTTNGTLPIAGWKLIFIILGCMTVAAGLLFGIFVPDTPAQARFLSQEDRILAVERIRANQQGVIHHTLRMKQVKEALTDPLTWLYAAVALLASVPNGGVTNFFSIIVQGFGFTTPHTLLLNMSGAYVAPTLIFTMWAGDKLKLRALISVVPLLLSILGTALVWGLPTANKIGRLIGFYLISLFVIGFIICLSLITSNVAGQTKKTTVNTVFLIFYCVGNLIGPQTFRAANAPRYEPALATIIACDSVLIILMIIIHFLYKKENAKRDAAAIQCVEGHEFDDLTDRENPAFRYTT